MRGLSHGQHFFVRPTNRRKAAHNESRKAISSYGELHAAQCQPGVAIVGKLPGIGRIGYSEQVIGNVIGG